MGLATLSPELLMALLTDVLNKHRDDKSRMPRGNNLLQALVDAKEKHPNAKVKYAFKGLHKNYESFAAVETPESEGIETLWTGSAMMKDLDDEGFVACLDLMLELNQNFDGKITTSTKKYKTSSKKYTQMKVNRGNEDEFKKCFPKALPKSAFLKVRSKYDTRALDKTGLTKTSASLKTADKFVVTGLVFDFCVLETAVFLRAGFQKIPVLVPLPETLPALAGLVDPKTPDDVHPLAYRMKDGYYDWVAQKYKDVGVQFTESAS